nr:putative integron gene cassette protein [uncultured bacterium]
MRMFALLVKIFCLVAAGAAGCLPVLVLYKILAPEGKRPKLSKFLAIELALLVSVPLLLLAFSGSPESISGFIITSLILTLLANLPVAIVVKIISFFIRPKEIPEDVGQIE